jgi:hypothetical protein
VTSSFILGHLFWVPSLPTTADINISIVLAHSCFSNLLFYSIASTVIVTCFYFSFQINNNNNNNKSLGNIRYSSIYFSGLL